MSLKTPFVFTVCLFLLLLGISNITLAVTNAKNGYKAIAGNNDGFIAVGTDGRIDRISKSGEIIKSEKISDNELRSLLSCEQTIIVAGEKGTLLMSAEDGIFKKIDVKTNNNINSLALFREYIIAGADKGELLIGNELGYFESIRLNLKGNIVSVSAGTSECYGVTDEGEVIQTSDGFNWKIFNFNEVYSGYYKPCSFTCVSVTENTIAVTGKNQDNSPVLFFSTQGNVWSERNLDYTDNKGYPYYLQEIPNSIFYDFPEDRFLLVCNKGKLMSIPSCSQCNKLIELATSENLKGIASNLDGFIIVGEGNYIDIIR